MGTIMPNIGNDVNQIKISSLSRIQGQPSVINLLTTNLESYFNQRATAKPENLPQFGSVLFTGPPGTGKSLVAKALHCELGNLTLIETNGELVNNVLEISSVLMHADDNTTVFIDEATMGIKTQNVLLTALSERRLYIAKSGNRRISYTVPLANFTLIMATNFEHQLSDALRNRMRICCRFNYYSIDDLITIIKTYANSLGWKYDENIIRIIASRSKQTPRLALNRNLQMVWNVCVSHNRDTMTLTDAEEAFQLLGVDELGLDTLERQYLRTLLNGATKLNVIASKTGLPVATISNVIEPFLLREALLDKNGSTRMITEKGKQHILHTEY
jgi:Holliday junction DNA helicase RuvB